MWVFPANTFRTGIPAWRNSHQVAGRSTLASASASRALASWHRGSRPYRRGVVAQCAIECLCVWQHAATDCSFPVEAGGAAPANGSHAMKFEIQLTGAGAQRKHVVEFERDVSKVSLDGRPVDTDAILIGPNVVSVMLGGQSFEFHISRSPDGTLKLRCGQHEFSADLTDPRAWRGRKHGAVEVE